MTREDVYAYLEELEPPERLMKQLYQNHQAISVENGLNGLSEGQNAQYMKRADEYKPHPLLQKLTHFETDIKRDDSAPLKSPSALEAVYTWDTYSDPGHDMTIVRHYRYWPGNFHRHDYIEISYVYSGSCRHVFHTEDGMHEVTLSPGDLVIIPPDMEHKVDVFNDGVMLNILTGVSIFQNLFLQNLTGSPALMEFFSAIIWEGRHPGVILLHTASDRMIADTLIDLVIHYVQNRLFSRQICEHFLDIWLLLILPYCTDTMELFGKTSGERKLVASIIVYLQKHYMETSLEDVAEEFHYSASHVNRVLKKHAGITVSKEIRRLKIRHACELLEQTDYSVESITGLVGYKNTSYFIEQFQKEMRMTPLKYRNQKSAKT